MPQLGALLAAAEFVTVMAFTAEYLARLACARPRLKFVFSFFGLVDLLSILPFYLATARGAVPEGRRLLATARPRLA